MAEEVTSMKIDEVTTYKEDLETLLEMRQGMVAERDNLDKEIKAYSEQIAEILNELGVRKIVGLPWVPILRPEGVNERLDQSLLLNFISAEDLNRCKKKSKRAASLTVMKAK